MICQMIGLPPISASAWVVYQFPHLTECLTHQRELPLSSFDLYKCFHMKIFAVEVI